MSDNDQSVLSVTIIDRPPVLLLIVVDVLEIDIVSKPIAIDIPGTVPSLRIDVGTE